MFENLIIANDLYNLREKLKDEKDILLINSLIKKYKTEINVDFEFTERELKGSEYVFRNLLKDVYIEPEFWIMPNKEDTSTWILNQELCDKIDLFDEKSEELIKRFSLLRLKNNKTKNQITRQNSILIQNVFLEEINELITKIF